jgi:hypothetical protein
MMARSSFILNLAEIFLQILKNILVLVVFFPQRSTILASKVW